MVAVSAGPRRLEPGLPALGHLASEWCRATCELLGVEPRAPITVMLDPLAPRAMTRESTVRLPLGPVNGVVWHHGVDPALSHELVHAICGPSASQLAGEGLAVHVDSTLRLAGTVWPFYGLAPDRWVRLLHDSGELIPLRELLEAPPMIQVVDTSAARRWWRHFYLEAGSLVRFLVGRGGLGPFLDTFPEGRVLAAGESIEALEASWLAAVGGPLSGDEQRRAELASETWLASAPSPANGGDTVRELR